MLPHCRVVMWCWQISYLVHEQPHHVPPPCSSEQLRYYSSVISYLTCFACQYLLCRARLLAGWQQRETQEVHPVLLGKGAGHAQSCLGSLRITSMVCCSKAPAKKTSTCISCRARQFFSSAESSLPGKGAGHAQHCLGSLRIMSMV